MDCGNIHVTKSLNFFHEKDQIEREDVWTVRKEFDKDNCYFLQDHNKINLNHLK